MNRFLTRDLVLWRGKAIEDMTRAELIAVINELGLAADAERRELRRQRGLLLGPEDDDAKQD